MEEFILYPRLPEESKSISWCAGHIANILSGRDGNDSLTGGGSNDRLLGGAGNDIYYGFNPSGSNGIDLIDDFSGSSDVLDLSNFNLNEIVSWSAIDSNGDGLVDDLKITLSNTGASIIIFKYFDNTDADDDLSGPGVGQIETIVFGDDSSVDFAQVQSLIP